MNKHNLVETTFGAKAPTPPRLGSKLVTEPTFEMIIWYYNTPNTISIDYFQIDDSVSIVIRIVLMEDTKKIINESIGPSIKKDIINRYIFYHS